MKSIISFRHVLTVVAILVPAILASTVAASANLANAKRLYASASYQEALNELENVPDASWDVQINQYRALCFLGLGRTREARAGARTLDSRQAAPFGVGRRRCLRDSFPCFAQIRGRTLPSIARELYARGKRAYKSGRLDEAATQLRQLGELLSAVDVFEGASALADVKELGDGFLKLTEEKLAAAAPRPARCTPPPPAVVPAIVTTDQNRPSQTAIATSCLPSTLTGGCRYGTRQSVHAPRASAGASWKSSPTRAAPWNRPSSSAR